jgi:hypothetical protein
MIKRRPYDPVVYSLWGVALCLYNNMLLLQQPETQMSLPSV